MKRITAFALALIMTLSLCPVTAYADVLHEEDVSVETSYADAVDFSEEPDDFKGETVADGFSDNEEVSATEMLSENNLGSDALSNAITESDLQTSENSVLLKATVSRAAYYSGTNIPTYTYVTGSRLINTSVYENNIHYMYYYDGDDMLYYIEYLENYYGWVLYDAVEYPNGIMGFLKKDGIIISVSADVTVGLVTVIIPRDTTVSPTSVSLNRSSLTLIEGNIYSLEATVSPSNATDRSITWTSSNSTVASVSGNGRVEAKSAGTATITAKTVNGKTASCSVSVKAFVLEQYEGTIIPTFTCVTGVTFNEKEVEGTAVRYTYDLDAMAFENYQNHLAKKDGWILVKEEEAGDLYTLAYLKGNAMVVVIADFACGEMVVRFYTSGLDPEIPLPQACWGLATGTNNTGMPTFWTSGTLTEAVTYANNLTSGTAYIQLLTDVDNMSPIEFASGKTTILDLNGHDIVRELSATTENDYIFIVDGTLTLCDSSTTDVTKQGKITGDYDRAGSGGVLVDAGNFTMNGGTISGNTTFDGGGVSVYQGQFTMNGGTISGNSAHLGGGVYVGTNGTFTMNGGSIFENIAEYNDCGVIYVGTNGTFQGGGVYVDTNGTFTMNGGTISGNSAETSGGGVYVGGTMTISGTPVVSGNTVSGTQTASNIYLPSGKMIAVGELSTGTNLGITMADGSGIFTTISASSVSSDFFTSDSSAAVVLVKYNRLYLALGFTVSFDANGGDGTMAAQPMEKGVATALNKNTFTRFDYTFVGWNTKADGTGTAYADGASIKLTKNTVLYAQWKAIQARWGCATGENNDLLPTSWTTGTLVSAATYANNLTSGTAYIQLRSDVITTAPIEFASGKTTILDLNGHDINRGLTNARENGNVLTVKGKLTLCDSSTTDVTKQGKITGGYSSNGGGVYVYNGTFTMQGGTISGNGTSSSGGGVYVPRGRFTLNGGAILENKATYASGSGGGVYVNGTFTMNGGTIAGNRATFGGGVYVQSTFTMNGGTISGNSAEYGGGVDVSTSGTFTLVGGAILENRAILSRSDTAGDGGGVWVLGTFTMNGGTIAENNAKTDAGGVGAYDGVFTMNGGTISGNSAERGGGGVDVYNYSTFTMSGGTISENSACAGGGGGVRVYSHSTFTMNGGAIFGNTAASMGGGVFVSASTFTMSGGTISENSASYSGGGVYVSATSSTFAMNGGAVSGNTASISGGGVYVEYAMFTMTSGTISENSASSGGGVYAAGTMEVSGTPVVFGNGADNVYLPSGKMIAVGELSTGTNIGITMADGNGIFTTGGASYANSGFFTSDSNAAVVIANGDNLRLFPGFIVSFDANGGTGTMAAQPVEDGVATVLNKNTFTRSDYKFVGWNTKADGTGTAYADEASITITNGMVLYAQWQLSEAHWGLASGENLDERPSEWVNWGSMTEAMSYANNLVSGTAYIQLISDVKTSAPLEFASGKTTILDLNSYDIDRGLTEEASDGSVIIVKGNLTLCDSSATAATNPGKITGGYAASGGGVRVETGIFTMNGGSISGNSADDFGGGVHVNGGTFTMNGGSISDNTADDDGGGVFSTGRFTMNGGTISGNSAARNGGGVDCGTATITGGTISGNSAIRHGGGVNARGAFTMSGGIIYGNTACYGGGVYDCYGTMYVSGTPIISENVENGMLNESTGLYENGTASNVYLESGKTITVDGALTENATVGVTTAIAPTNDVPVTVAQSGSDSAYTLTVSDVAKFTSDNGYVIALDSSTNTVQLENPLHKVAFDMKGHGYQIDSQVVSHNTLVTEPNNPTENGYIFGGWYKDPECTDSWEFDIDTVIEPTTLYAKWEIIDGLWCAEIPDYTYTGKAITPEIEVYYRDTLLTLNKDYSISYKNNTNAATSDAKDSKGKDIAPVIIIKGKGNFAGTLNKTFTILPIDLNDKQISVSDVTALYNGKGQNPKLSVSWGTKKLSTKDFTVSYPDTRNEKIPYQDAGTWTLQLNGTGNFTGTRYVNFTITSGQLMSKATIGKFATYEYTGEAIEPEVAVTMGKVPLVEGIDYTVEYLNNIEVGTATVVVTGMGNYAGTKTATFKINGLAISKVQVNDIPKSVMYTGEEIELEGYSLFDKATGEFLEKGTHYTVDYDKNVDKGTATILFTGINNYTGTLKKTFKIDTYDILKDVDGRIEVEGDIVAPYMKGGAKPEPVITFNGEPLVAGVDYTLAYKNNTAVADANSAKAPMITISGKGNFAGKLTVNFSIEAKKLSEVELIVDDKPYTPKATGLPTVTLTDADGKKLAAGKDYDKLVSYTYTDEVRLDDGTLRSAGDTVDKKDIIPVDTVLRVTVVGIGPYTGEAITTYRIVPLSLAKATVKVANQQYTGKPIFPDKSDITVTVNKVNIDPDNFEIVSCANNVNKGSATLTIRGVSENYGGVKTVKFKIDAKTMFWYEVKTSLFGFFS